MIQLLLNIKSNGNIILNKLLIVKNIYIFILLFGCTIQAQTLDELKKLDTLYFYFSESEYQKKDSYNDMNVNDSLIIYAYYKNNKELIRLKYSKFEDFDAQFADISTYKKYHKKRFLKKNKERLITIDFLDNLNLEERNEFLDSRRWKKNFIIDEEEIKGRKILIRRAFVNSPFSTDDNEEVYQLYPKRYLNPFYEESGLNDDFFTFIIPKKKLTSATEDLYILFEPSELAVKEDTCKHFVQQGNTYSAPRVQEQYTFKLNINNQTVFFQLTHKRKESQKLEKKYDLFSKQHETVSFQDLDSFSEKQLEDLFARTRNIYIVENFTEKEYVIPLLVTPTSYWVDFVKNNND